MTVSAVKLVAKNLNKVVKGLEKSNQNRIKAARSATKKMAFELTKRFKREIKVTSAPGGQKFKPLSEMARNMGGKKRGKFKALTKPGKFSLDNAVRYRVDIKGDNFT